MYTRKQFFVSSAKQCFKFCRSCLSVPSIIEEDFKGNLGRPNHESLFLEAMRLGIDPGTMDMKELSRTVKLIKKQKR